MYVRTYICTYVYKVFTYVFIYCIFCLLNIRTYVVVPMPVPFYSTSHSFLSVGLVYEEIISFQMCVGIAPMKVQDQPMAPEGQLPMEM